MLHPQPLQQSTPLEKILLADAGGADWVETPLSGGGRDRSTHDPSPRDQDGPCSAKPWRTAT